MLASDQLWRIVRRLRDSANEQGMDPFESTRRVIELSDEIAAIQKRMLERSRSGSPEDYVDRERLTLLMGELQSKRSGKDRSANRLT